MLAGAYVWWDLQDVLKASGMQNKYCRGGGQLSRYIFDTWTPWLGLAESCNSFGSHFRKARPKAHTKQQRHPGLGRVLDEHSASTFGMLIVFLRTAVRSLSEEERRSAQQFMQELLAFFSKEPADIALYYDRSASASPEVGCNGSNEQLLICHGGVFKASELRPPGAGGHMLHAVWKCLPDLQGSSHIPLGRILVAALGSDTLWLLRQLIITCGHLIETAVKGGSGD